MNKEFSTFADGSDCKECVAAERKIKHLTARLAEAEAAVKAQDEEASRTHDAWGEEVNAYAQRLAAASAAARFYARYYDGPSEALLGEADRKAFQWIERAEKAGGWE